MVTEKKVREVEDGLKESEQRLGSAKDAHAKVVRREIETVRELIKLWRAGN